MAVDIRLPNITATDAGAQVAQMRSYLYQMVEQLNWALATLESGKTAVENGTVVAADGSSSETTLGQFKGLRDLIAKSAETARTEIERLDDALSEVKKDYKSIRAVEEEYYRSASPTELAGGEWSSQYPGWVEGSYIWTRSVIYYTDGTAPTRTAAVCVTGTRGATGPQGEAGATGPQGPQGEKGDTGAPGEAGPEGPRGPQGEAGPKGDTGETGATGPQGEKGDTGQTGPQGPQGEPGKPGADGVSPTVRISKDGGTTTITITDKDGTHRQTVEDGTDGTPGAPGADGKTPYFHVKYSDDGGKTFTADGGETPGEYIGTYTDYTREDSTAADAYAWAKIKGETGDTGPQGEKGDTGSPGQQGPQGEAGPKGETGQTGPEGPRGPQGETGATGPQGETGVGVENVDVEYRLSGSDTELTGTDDEGKEYTWQTDMPALKDGLHLWSRSRITYTDGTVEYTGQYCVTRAAWDAVAGKVDGKVNDRVQAVYRSMEELETNLKGRYVAQGDFGTFAEDTNARIKANAEAIEQKYEDVQRLRSEVEEVAGAVVAVNANIRTGLLYYDNGAPVYGVEVGQRTRVNGEEVFNKYARFISNRLSFYDQSGNEVSYISDYKLYITNAVVTGNLQVGGYMLDTTKGLGFKWIGR